MRLAFDFDGVLVDSMQSNIDAINNLSERYSFEPLTTDSYRGMLTVNFSQYWQMLLGNRCEEFFADLHTQPRGAVTFVPGMKDVLLAFSPAIVSSNHSVLIAIAHLWTRF